MHYDVLIVGAGLGGLTCGARLSKLGYKVAVFEHHYLAGGYATNFQRKGYTFDVSLHGTAGLGEGQSYYQILEQCGVMQRITPLQKKHPYSISIDGNHIDIPQDPSAYRTLLEEMFPHEKEGISRLFSALHQFYGEMQFISNPNIPSWRKGLSFPFKCSLLLKWSKRTTEQVIKQYVKDGMFLQMFTVLWSYYGLPPKDLSALYFFIPWTGYHIEGTYYIKGGAQALSDALVDSIREHGGEVFLRKEVAEILVNADRAYGVNLSKGEEVTGDWIVSNANPFHTLNTLISGNEKTNSYVQSLAKKEVGPSLLQLYLGLSCDPDQLGIVEEDLFMIEEKDHTKDYENARSGHYHQVNLMLTNYNKMDPTLNKIGKGVVTVTCIDSIDNWPDQKEIYESKKQEVIDILLQRLENKYPGIKEHVVISELGTPRTMERYTYNERGAVYGFAQTVSQSGINRPGSQTPIKGLSLVGAWTRPGGGFQGASLSGFLEAEKIHRKLIKGNKRIELFS